MSEMHPKTKLKALHLKEQESKDLQSCLLSCSWTFITIYWRESQRQTWFKNGTHLWLISKWTRTGCLKWHTRVLLSSEAKYRGTYLNCKISFHFRRSAWHSSQQWGLLEVQKCKIYGDICSLTTQSLGLQVSPFPIRSQGRQYGSSLPAPKHGR